LNHDFATDIKLLSFLFLICVSMWITEREWFQTVLISWIQLSNHFCFGWVQDLQTITSKCFSYLNQNVVTTVKLLTFWCVEAYDLLKESGFQLLWYGESNYQIIFAVGWLEYLQTINDRYFAHLRYDIVTGVKLLGN